MKRLLFVPRQSSTSRASDKVDVRLHPVLLREHPDILIVVGDVNSTVAAALSASKLAVSVAHVEAGLRSGDRSMPEELNRRPPTSSRTVGLASMGPRPSRRGDVTSRGVCWHVVPLQWGHALPGVETLCVTVKCSPLVMLQWGHAIPGVET